MTTYDKVQDGLVREPRSWLVTGCAGFIGSHLAECLLQLGQKVIGLDNFATGHRANLEDVRTRVGEAGWARFGFVEGDVGDLDTCLRVCDGVELVLHQAALGSVPRSLEDPLSTHRANVDGFLNMLLAARATAVDRFVYASSSSVYGDHPGLPKVEEKVGRPLSPYALTKAIDEQYADVFHRCYEIETVGLRYFNVFGARQDPEGPYAAVIPKWVGRMLDGEKCVIYGDGLTSRDFCYVSNAVQANLLAATIQSATVSGEVFNVAVGSRTCLNELFELVRDGLLDLGVPLAKTEPAYGPFREGDVRHSLAAIDHGRDRLGYEPSHTLAEGLAEALPWYVENRRGA